MQFQDCFELRNSHIAQILFGEITKQSFQISTQSDDEQDSFKNNWEKVFKYQAFWIK